MSKYPATELSEKILKFLNGNNRESYYAPYIITNNLDSIISFDDFIAILNTEEYLHRYFTFIQQLFTFNGVSNRIFTIENLETLCKFVREDANNIVLRYLYTHILSFYRSIVILENKDIRYIQHNDISNYIIDNFFNIEILFIIKNKFKKSKTVKYDNFFRFLLKSSHRLNLTEIINLELKDDSSSDSSTLKVPVNLNIPIEDFLNLMEGATDVIGHHRTLFIATVLLNEKDLIDFKMSI